MSPETPAFRFDRATAVRARDDEPMTYDVEIDPSFTVGPKAHGGYLLATAARAAGAAAGAAGSPHRDPLAATAHFLASPDPGPATVEVQVLRTGRSASQVRTTIVQHGVAQVDASFTLASLPEAPSGAAWSDVPAPDLPAPDACVLLPAEREGSPFRVSIAEEADMLADPAVLGFASGARHGRGMLQGWIRFADGRPADPLGVLFFLDALPPASLDLVPSGWVPTLSISAYLRSRPAPGPLRVRQYVRHLQERHLDEVCEVWDAEGRLVGQATQLAGIRYDPADLTRTSPPPFPIAAPPA